MSKITVVTSGKGGTGKTTVSTGLAVAFARKNEKVLLIDCDCGMRGVDLMFGIESKLFFDIADAVNGNCDIRKAIYAVDKIKGLYVIPAPIHSDNEVSPQLMQQLISTVKKDFDRIIIDSPAGVGSGFESAASCADSAIIVVNPEPISIRGCLNVRTRLMQKGVCEIRLVINRLSKDDFLEMGIYPDLDSVIDCAQTQLLGVVEEDKRLACMTQCGQAGMYWCKSLPVFECMANRLEGANINLVCKL